MTEMGVYLPQFPKEILIRKLHNTFCVQSHGKFLPKLPIKQGSKSTNCSPKNLVKCKSKSKIILTHPLARTAKNRHYSQGQFWQGLTVSAHKKNFL